MPPKFGMPPNPYIASRNRQRDEDFTVTLKARFGQLFPDPDSVLCPTTGFRDNSHLQEAIPQGWANRQLGFYLAGACEELKAAMDRWDTAPRNLYGLVSRLRGYLGEETPPSAEALSDHWAIVYAGAARILKLNDPEEEHLLMYHLGRAEKWLAGAISTIYSYEEGSA